ncbi:hypothetical protein Goari_004407, partial [Gossypium aridum]|nr:hypothetical protein [Gossypium aridum]
MVWIQVTLVVFVVSGFVLFLSIEEDFVVDSAVRAKSTLVWGVWKRFGSAFTYWYGGDGMARRSGGGDAYNAGKLMASSRRLQLQIWERRDFWVQIHDFPTGLMSKMMARQFGVFLGIDVRKPLIRRKKLLLENKGCTYARFQYEKLLVFYFLC